MPRNLMENPRSLMTKSEAIAQFEEDWNTLPLVHRSDKVAKRCAFNDFVDALNKQGLISDQQADTWTNPFDK